MTQFLWTASANYIIATSPRSGSYLLCEALMASGIAGRPHEYAGPADGATWNQFNRFPTHAAYFFQFADLCRSANGIVGVKFMVPQLLEFVTDARRYLRSHATPIEALKTLLGTGRVIRLRRRDRFRQAVSWVRAQQTGEWSKNPSADGRSICHYDIDALRDAVIQIARQEHYWERFIVEANLPVHHIDYEDLDENYSSAVTRVLSFLGFSEAVPIRAPAMVKQADALTDEWLQRLVADLGDYSRTRPPSDG
jgi:LPS sulfotransferase NodH